MNSFFLGIWTALLIWEKWKQKSLQIFIANCLQNSNSKDEEQTPTMRAYIFLVVIFATVCTSWAGLLVGAPKTDKSISSIEQWNYFFSNYYYFINDYIIIDHPNQCFVTVRANGRLMREAFSVGTHTPAGKCVKVFCQRDFSYVVHTYVEHINCVFPYILKTPNLNICFISF